MKLPVCRTGLPGKELSFHIVPLDPAHKARVAGHLPVKRHCIQRHEAARTELYAFPDTLLRKEEYIS